LKNVEHVGNIYRLNEIGDINIIELKMSESKKGRGKLANFSQKLLIIINCLLK